MKKTINIDGVDPILFVGLNDQNIKVLEQNYNSKIVVCGSSMNLDGKKEEIIDNLAVREFCENWDSCDLISIPKAKHDLLMEREIILHNLFEELEEFIKK